MSGNITEHATNNIDAQHSVIALGPQVRLPENTHGAKLQAELMQLLSMQMKSASIEACLMRQAL